jgi:CubicO group peptidase (beta-lactamase class C family)
MDLDQADQILRDETTDDPADIGRGATCSATQAVVWHNGRIAYEAAYGQTDLGSRGRPVGPTTPFDVASLTKPLVVGTLLMQAVREDLCHWYDPVDDYLGDWSADDRAGEVTILQLANHTSGLPDWRPLYDDLPTDPDAADVTTNRRRILTDIYHTRLDGAPGAAECYSDLGYIVLGCLLESVFGGPLDELARERIFAPLGMDRTEYVSAAAGDAPVDGAAATEDDELRGGVVRGTVHDRNAAAFGGVAGHAGVFSTAHDLAAFGGHLANIDREREVEEPLVARETLQFAWSEEAGGETGHHLAGWDTPSGDESTAGRGFRDGETVGHLGFTGTSIWIERGRGLVAVLMTNRVYPDRDNDRINPIRRRFHEAILPP